MKKVFYILIQSYFLIIAAQATAQMVVNDPANTKVNTLIHFLEKAALEVSEQQSERIKEHLEVAKRQEELLRSVPNWLLDSPKLQDLYATEKQILALYGEGLYKVGGHSRLQRKERSDILKIYSGILNKSTMSIKQLQYVLFPGKERAFTQGERLAQLDQLGADLAHSRSMMAVWHEKVMGYLQEKRTTKSLAW